MSTTALARTNAATPDAREAALIKAIGFDRVPAEQRELAMHIADRYGLDLMLRHIVMVDGKPYITRDGLLHVAHRSGVFDGIEVTDPVLEGGYWRARATVYRKDMSRGIAYPGRYPEKGRNQAFGPEMAIKVGEVMALRRAFDVSAPVLEERWDMDESPAPVERQTVPLAAKAAASRARIEARQVDAVEVPGTFSDGARPVSASEPNEPPVSSPVASGEVDAGSGPAPSPDTTAVLGEQPTGLTDQGLREWLRERYIGITAAQQHIRATWGEAATIASITDEQRAATAAAVEHLAK